MITKEDYLEAQKVVLRYRGMDSAKTFLVAEKLKQEF